MKFSVEQIDSLIHDFEKDSSNTSKQSRYLHLIESNETDTLLVSKAKWQIVQIDSSLANKLVNEIISYESFLQKSTQGRNLLAKVFTWHRKASFKEGNIEQVVKDCERYLYYAKPTDDTLNRVQTLNSLGTSYEKLGDSKKAIATLELGFSLASAYKNPDLIFNIASDLANSFAQNDQLQKAQEIVKKVLMIESMKPNDKDWFRMMKANFESDKLALKILFETSNSLMVKQTSAKILKNIYVEEGNYKTALYYTFQSIPQTKSEPRELAKTYLTIGEIYQEEQMADSAMFYYDQGLSLLSHLEMQHGVKVPNFQTLKPENTIYDLLIAKSDLLSLSTQVDSNLIQPQIYCLNAAMKVCELLREEMIFDDSKYEMSGDLKLVSEKLLQLYFKLYERYHKEEYKQAAFMIVENSKAVTLQDHIEQDILMNEKSDSNYAQFISIRKQLNDVEIELNKMSESKVKDSLNSIKLRLTSSLGIYSSLSQAIRPNDEKPFLFNDLTTYLASHKQAVLSYFIAENEIHVFYLNSVNHQLEWKRCDTSILSKVKTVCEFQRDAFGDNSNQTSFTRVSNVVYQTLVGSILPKKFNQPSLLILADGILNNLAFDALNTDSISPSSFLVKKLAIGNAYSIRSLIMQEKRNWNDSKSSLALAPFSASSHRNLKKLEGSYSELQVIRQLPLHFNIELDTNATFKNFESQLENSYAIHIASHASSNEIPHLEFYDSSILVHSIYQMPMNQQFAFLNTCQSGDGTTILGEGNLSLGRAFYNSGVHNIVLSYWNMNDQSSALLSQLFYQHLNKSANIIEALHQAKLDYLAQQPADKQLPYYWASLYVIGDGTIKPHSSNNHLPLYIIIISSLLLIIWQRKRILKIVSI